jgi:biopolymer transport protein ExbB
MNLLDSDWLPRLRLVAFAIFGVLLFMLWQNVSPHLAAQDAAGPMPAPPSATDPAAAPPPAPAPAAAPGDPAAEQPEDIITLFLRGGFWMWPIAFLSAIAATFTIERFLGLRPARVLPQELVEGLGRLASGAGGFDPREAYKVCQKHPSTASNVIQDMLLKVGRPHSEVENTVAESSQREAEKLYANVRWINLATAVAPLVGLLGTAWGMVLCFQALKLLGPAQNKLAVLSDGIYTALMTTVFGLCVAIPASIFAHLFEGWIQQYMHQISELIGDLMPQIERYEGRVRFGKFEREGEAEANGAPRAETAERKPAAAK